MINKEGKLNLSVSGGSDLNQDLVENSDYTKLTPESEMMNDDGAEAASKSGDETMMSGDSEEDDDQKEEDSVANNSDDDNYKVSDMNNRMNVERDNEPDENSQPTQMKNSPTENDMPYDVPDDQTPPMMDMPKNIEKMTKKEAPNQTGSE